MRLKVVIVDLEVPPRVKKWVLRIGIPLGLLLGGGAIAWAGGLHTWKKADTLQASDLNGNFADLQNEIAGDGGVQAQITTAQLGPRTPSAFHAWRTTTLSVPANTTTTIVFDYVGFDIPSEYDSTTGIFSPQRAGVYTIFCAAQFVSISGNVYTTIILDDGVSIGGTDLQSSTGYSINPEATVVTELAAGAHVTCNAYQVSGTSQSTTTAAQRTAFGAARLY